MTTILDRIKAYKLDEIAARKARHPREVVEEAARKAPRVRDFRAGMDAALRRVPFAVIAEIKKASPSKGLIRDAFDPPALARAYAKGGAACLSVLTDTPSFQGADDHLPAAREAVTLPVLRKDFLFDPYQVAEARALGADCILIIMAAVSDAEAAALERTAFAWGMDVLVEIHDEAELDRALKLDSPLIGVNNRNLHSFETTLETTERLVPLIPGDRIIVAESGLSSRADLERLAAIGVTRFLIGESLMRQTDVAGALEALIGAGLSAQAMP